MARLLQQPRIAAGGLRRLTAGAGRKLHFLTLAGRTVDDRDRARLSGSRRRRFGPHLRRGRRRVLGGSRLDLVGWRDGNNGRGFAAHRISGHQRPAEKYRQHRPEDAGNQRRPFDRQLKTLGFLTLAERGAQVISRHGSPHESFGAV